MAVQLPNFLSAQLINPDYSGLADIFQNYYGGKALKQQDIIGQNQAKAAPLDLLMKQIQAEFARPNAETALTGAKLGNQSTGLSNQNTSLQIQQLKKQIAENAAIENQIKAAIAQQQAGQGGGMQGGGGFGGQAQPEMPDQMQSQGMYQPVKMNDMSEALSKVMANPMMRNQPAPMTNPLMEEHPEGMQKIQTHGKERFQELDPGTSSLYGIDQLWDRNPMARPLIEKRYGKKDVKREYDKSTGATRLVTTWPSGRRTVKTIMPPIEQDEGEDIPLSKSGMGKVEDEIRGADVLVPYLDTIIDIATPTNDLIKEKQNLSKTDESKSKNIDRIKKIDEALKGRNTAGGIYNETQMPYFSNVFGFNFPSNASAKYHRIVNKALESYASSGKLPKTNESIERVHQILSRGTNESNKQFYDQLVQERKEQIEKRARNVKLMKKGISRFGTSSLDPETQSYSSNEWEVTGER